MSEITTVPQPSLGFAEMERLAVSIAKSGMFGMKTPEQALVLMAIAQAEGRHPALAARDYDVIQGKPAKKAEAMMRDFLEAGGKVEWHALTDLIADATFTHPQTGSVRIDWTLERANTAGLAGKSTWKQFPRQMLRSRVVSEGVRTLWPLATSGFYVPEEQADIPAAEHPGPTIESTASDERTAINDAVPLQTAATATPRAKPLPDYTDAQWDAWIVKLRAACEIVQHREELVEMADGKRMVGKALAEGPDWVKRDIDDILAANYKRLAEAETAEEDELPDVEIEGERNVMAG